MIIKEAIFHSSYTSVDRCPDLKVPEYAFIGRSNVGKSSLINMLTGKKNLAKTSATPGKTQLINLFLINKQWAIADLPGYGFAKISKQKREEWNKMIDDYFRKRKNLITVFVLVDSRLSPQPIDLEFINKVGEYQIPLVVAFTKTDKLSNVELSRNVKTFLDALSENWESSPLYMKTSSSTGEGREEVLGYIELTNKEISEIRKRS